MINKGILEAKKIINQFGITRPNEYSLEEIIAGLKGPIIKYERLVGSEGRIVNSKEFSIITINENSNIQRQRFTLAHELGHYVMHRNKRLIYDTEDNFWDWNSYNQLETEANYFAAELLMPEEIFLKYTRKEPFSIEYIKNTAKEFNTSFLATAIRYAETGNDPIALICSQNNLIKWFRVHRKFPFINLKMKEIHSGTLTNDYYNNKFYGTEIDIDPKSWMINSQGYEELKFIESIEVFKQYNYILTFISITK